MANIYPTVLSSKRSAKGVDKIRIAISHNGKTRYIVTEMEVKQGEFRAGRVIKRPDATLKNAKISATIAKIEKKMSQLDYIDGLSCSELISAIQSGPAPCRLGDVFEEYISTARVKDSTKRLMKNCTSSLFKLLGDDFPLAALNYAKIMAYENKLFKAGNCSGTVRTKMAIFSKIVKYAILYSYLGFVFLPPPEKNLHIARKIAV